jgi:hypothetical protein
MGSQGQAPVMNLTYPHDDENKGKWVEMDVDDLCTMFEDVISA